MARVRPRRLGCAFRRIAGDPACEKGRSTAIAFGNPLENAAQLLPRSSAPWERGNRWVLEMAQTRGAKKITLDCTWDGKTIGVAPGGTAQMVQIAREAGTVDIVSIDAGQLLS